MQDFYLLLVRAWDSGTPTQFADTSVNITVVEESKFPPTVYPLQVTIFSFRDAFSGGIIGKINAVDKDPFDVLRYSVGASINQNSGVEYFDVDGQDGTLVAITPLDEGQYYVNISITDGKFTRSVDASITVHVLTEDMIENSVILTMGPVSPDEFIARYRSLLVKVIAAELIETESNVVIISLQSRVQHFNGTVKRIGREIRESLDVLLVIKKNEKYFYSRPEIMKSLQARLTRIHRKLSLDFFEVMKPACSSETKCSNHGDCFEDIFIKDDIMMPLNTRLSSVVAPRFEHVAACRCQQGYDGVHCGDLVNACGHRPCSKHQKCSPTDLTSKGYMCHCPEGYAGKMCEIDISKCDDISCYYPSNPLSFIGNSYAQYSISQLEESSAMQLSLYLRSKQSVGVISFTSGIVDYSILEVLDGFVQYRWECGSGEGTVRASNQRVDDGKWHLINLTREGTVAILSVDGGKSSSVAPGDNDVLNINSESMFFGAQVSFQFPNPNIVYGFVGCIDQITFDEKKLPFSLKNGEPNSAPSLKRLVDVDLFCPDTLPSPGICGSHPCYNGGTCLEISSRDYKCTCSPRYTGKQCQVDNAPCSSSPCLHNGVCVVSGYSFACECPSNLSGRRCEYGIHCNPNPCDNGGRCEEGIRGPICKCHHFFGHKCEQDIDECVRNPCQNEGQCLNFFGGFSCLCQPNFTGKYCNDVVSDEESLGFSISLEELVIVLTLFIAFALIVVIIGSWQRKRWKQKRQQQNNRVKLTSHVKNDLSSVERPNRNSKICNVEADQVKISVFV